MNRDANPRLKILIATGIYPPQIGGPAQYSFNLERVFRDMGHDVQVVAYGVEHKLPVGIRHIYYFFRLVRHLFSTDFLITMDTFSVGFPAVCATLLFRKKMTIRIGGDFLWESYIERSGDPLPLSKFYQTEVSLTFKEKLIRSMMGFTLRHSSSLAFTTNWQKEITVPAYNLKEDRTFIVGNFVGEKIESFAPEKKDFIWAVRPIKLKNGDALAEAFNEAQKKDPSISLDTELVPYNKLMEKMQHTYAAILPSISEVCPNFILDAIRCNKPFIVTRETGMFDIIKDIGIFVDPLNTKDIEEKILLLADQNTYQKQVEKIKAFTYTHNWHEIAQEYLTLYNSL